MKRKGVQGPDPEGETCAKDGASSAAPLHSRINTKRRRINLETPLASVGGQEKKEEKKGRRRRRRERRRVGMMVGKRKTT